MRIVGSVTTLSQVESADYSLVLAVECVQAACGACRDGTRAKVEGFMLAVSRNQGLAAQAACTWTAHVVTPAWPSISMRCFAPPVGTDKE